MNKYSIDPNEDEILPNLLNLKDKDAIDIAEFEGFLYAELLMSKSLSIKTKFDCGYIKKIHFEALNNLYLFAGKYRTVNLSKGDFTFPAARFLPQSMDALENEILQKLPNNYGNTKNLIKDIAIVHAELLFIHPFREGNGRTARMLANLMARKQGHEGLNFEKIDEKVFLEYVTAVQMAAKKNYEPMIEIIELVF